MRSKYALDNIFLISICSLLLTGVVGCATEKPVPHGNPGKEYSHAILPQMYLGFGDDIAVDWIVGKKARVTIADRVLMIDDGAFVIFEDRVCVARIRGAVLFLEPVDGGEVRMVIAGAKPAD